MPSAKHFLLASAFLAGCASQNTTPDADQLVVNHEAIATQSCPDDVPHIIPEKISLMADPVGWGEGAGDVLSPLVPVEVYHLTSDHPLLGGLSGLDFLDDNTLLSVSDMGAMVWLDIEADDLTPDDSAYLTLLKGEEGQPLDGKDDGDSEGIAWNGEYAFVSLERRHRILAFDLEACGANARGVPVVAFGAKTFDLGKPVSENSGIEALTDFGRDLLAGVETRTVDMAPLARLIDGQVPVFDILIPAPDLTSLTGLEFVSNDDGSGRLYAVTRSYDPLRGNQIGLVTANISAEGDMSEPEILTIFGKEITVDNFEGIAVKPIADGKDRIFIISDDNFSDRQRTLLAVLDRQLP